MLVIDMRGEYDEIEQDRGTLVPAIIQNIKSLRGQHASVVDTAILRKGCHIVE